MTADNTVKVENMVERLDNDTKRLHEDRQKDHTNLLAGIHEELQQLRSMIENQNGGAIE